MKDERIYKLEGIGEFPSVTTVLGQIDKSGPLMGWAVKTAIQYLQDHPKELANDPMATFKAAKGWHKELKQQAADLGSAAHNCIEVYLKGQKIDGILEVEPKVKKPFDAFLEWQKNYKFELVKSEHIIYSKEHRYAGTLDCMAYLSQNGDKPKLTLVDFKTSNAIYDEYIYQVAAYLKAYEEMNKVKVERCGILRLGKEDGLPEWREITEKEVETGFELFECFLRAWWIKKEGKDGLKSSKTNK